MYAYELAVSRTAGGDAVTLIARLATTDFAARFPNADAGKPVNGERYLAYLKTVLPDYFMKTGEFTKYREALLGRETPQPGKTYGW